MGKYGLRSVLKTPDLVLFGTNTIDNLGDLAKKFGNRVSLIYGGNSLKESGGYERIIKVLNNKNLKTSEINGVRHDPDELLVKDTVARVKEIMPDVIIGVGGGSVIDVAKACAIIATNDGEVRDYWEGREFTKPSIPFLAVPTTSGTGSEATENAVITSRDKTFKKSIRSEYMIPNVALVDPSLTLSVPPQATADTGLDALIQNLEAFTSKNSGPITDTLAYRGIELSGRYLTRVVKNPSDLEAREALSLSSLYGGINLKNAGLGLAHGISHPLGIRFGVPHGKACAIVMAKVMEYNYPACRKKYDEVGRLIAGIPHGIDAFKRLMDELGISTFLRDYGVKSEDIPLIVLESRGGSRNFNPIAHSDEEVAKMLGEIL